MLSWYHAAVAHSVMIVSWILSVRWGKNPELNFICLIAFSGVRTALLESEDNECPDCNEKGSSPGSLIPNRFLRNSVNAFRSETGYIKPRQEQSMSQKYPIASTVQYWFHVSNQVAKPPPPPPQENSQPVAEVEQLTTGNEAVPAQENSSANAETSIAADVSDETTVSTSQRSPKADGSAAPSPRNDSGHDDSDFEDNITVTVPPPHLQGGNLYRDRHLNGRHGRHHRHNTGIDTPPKNPHLVNICFFISFFQKNTYIVYSDNNNSSLIYSNSSTVMTTHRQLMIETRMQAHHKILEWSRVIRMQMS